MCLDSIAITNPGSDAMSGNNERVKPAELTPNELEVVSGGVSLSYSTIEWTYVKQTAAGSESTSKPGH
jgi:type VI protein secretion system component Hcp